jgi:hypothetical protein
MSHPKSLRSAGIFFGMWLSWLYAFVADQSNRVSLPEIPLPEPQGGVWGYYLGALVVGALIGLACTWPNNSWAGGAFGGLSGACLVFLAPWQPAFGPMLRMLGANSLIITVFIPRLLVLVSVALLIRFSVNYLPPGIEGFLTPRRLGLPVLTTVLALVLGFTGQYSGEMKTALYQTRVLVEQGLAVSDAGSLPEQLQPVAGFIPNATGRYTLEWSNLTARFKDLRPVSSRSASDFLIIVRFQNGFTLACVFAPGVKLSPCANYQ